MSLIDDFISLIYPNICAACGNSLFKHEEVLCNFCEFHLPQTNFHMDVDNPVAAIFWGRIKLESAASYYHFNKGSKVQRLIHLLKYKGRRDIGIYLGRQYGHFLKNSPLFNTVDVVLPVPLHWKKLRKRGYNQSEQFALGLGKSMKIPVDTLTLYRKLATLTQTKKSRFKRWENVAEIFALREPEKLSGKHVLLVDDVITTGATIEASILALNAIPGIRISVASIAAAMS
jgi:ComF family protein